MASESEIEEERRLFYVAMTRAKKAVAFSFAQTRMRNGKHESNSPSRFVHEVDAKYIANPLSKERESGEVKRESFKLWKKDSSGAPRPQPVVNKRPEPVPVRRPSPVPVKVNNDNFEPTPVLQLRAGQRIEHNRFGFGKILEISGNSSDLKAKISFDDHGEKILILKYAKIRVINVGQ